VRVLLVEETLIENNETVENMVNSCRAGSSEDIKPNERIWRCAFCTDTFKTENTMKAHSKIHNGFAKSACPRCPTQFKRAKACNVHYNAHLVTKRYSCGKCIKEFANKNAMEKHEKMHAQIRCRINRRGRWLCKACHKSFWKKSDWAQHLTGLRCLDAIRVTEGLRASVRKLNEFKKSLGFYQDYSPRDYSYPPSSDEMDEFVSDTGSSYFSHSFEASSKASDGSVEDSGDSESGLEKPEAMVTSTTED